MEGKESLRFQGPPSTEIDIFHYGVKMYMCCSIGVAVFVWVWVVWQQAARRSSILLQPYPKVCVRVCVCTFVRICAGMFVRDWGTCVCVCAERESGGKLKKHDLWEGVVLESARYSDACKS